MSAEILNQTPSPRLENSSHPQPPNFPKQNTIWFKIDAPFSKFCLPAETDCPSALQKLAPSKFFPNIQMCTANTPSPKEYCLPKLCARAIQTAVCLIANVPCSCACSECPVTRYEYYEEVGGRGGSLLDLSTVDWFATIWCACKRRVPWESLKVFRSPWER